MKAEPGQNLLHFRLLAKIGEGGMGEVWRAVDTTLDREVAIKLLPPAVATDAERLARFEREAKVLASLNHPNVAAIHGFHDSDGRRFLTMELVAGEDLSDRIRRGPIPVREALDYARKIADALEYAHDRGIVHRDLKPANVKVTPEGVVKVLDFGLAKAMTGDPSASSPTSTPTMMPTLTSAGTAAGLILGTAAYMSPEQARGRPVDKRADIWALGCVLYEMLVGRRLFDGETVTDVLAAVVTRDPDWNALPGATPSSVRRLLARCLDRDPRTRLRDAGEARIVLASPDHQDPARPEAPSPPGERRWWPIAAASALVVGVVVGRFMLAPETPAPRTFEFDVTVPGNSIESGSFALSPDGSRLALVVRDTSGDRQLAVRDMNLAEVRILPNTKGAFFPFWSPDGEEIGFFTENQLRRIALDGAAARPIATVDGPMGGAWGPGDVILVGSASGPILKVAASGGRPPETVTEVEKGVEDTHCWPSFLPDGKRFVFLSDASTDEGHRVHLASLEGGPTRILKRSVRSQPVLDPSGRLLLGERGQLVAYPFDLERGSLGEESSLMATQVYPIGSQHHLPATVTRGGMVAYQRGSPESKLVLVDHAGRVTRTVGEAERFGNPAISPDGKHVAFEIFTDTPERLVWVHDIDRGVRTPVSQRGTMSDSAAWSPDGETIYFDSMAGGEWIAYRTMVSGGGDPEPLGTPKSGEVAVMDVSRDGRWLLVNHTGSEIRDDLYLRSLASGSQEWIPWLTGPAAEDRGCFSPDSNWIAYTSNASGRVEVYLAPRQGGPTVHRWQLSSGGGFEPRFSPDGRTVYYRSAAWEWMAVDVSYEGGKVVAGTPRFLFSMTDLGLPWQRNLVDVLPDGSGFVTLHSASSRAMSIRVRTGK